MGQLPSRYGKFLTPVPGIVIAGLRLNNLTTKQPLVAMIVKFYSYCVQTANTGLADEMQPENKHCAANVMQNRRACV